MGPRIEKCMMCGKYLIGIHAYGTTHNPLCWHCYSKVNGQDQSWYGLAPHEHSYDENGEIIIGGTRFVDEVAEEFTPDPDAPNCGIWNLKAPAGWR
jgi:hypothetical protein